MKAQNARSFSYVFVVDFKFGNIDQEIALLFFILIFSFYGDKKKVKQKVKRGNSRSIATDLAENLRTLSSSGESAVETSAQSQPTSPRT